MYVGLPVGLLTEGAKTVPNALTSFGEAIPQTGLSFPALIQVEVLSPISTFYVMLYSYPWEA